MKKVILTAISIFAGIWLFEPACATYNATVAGTITIVQQDSGVLFTPETKIFQLSTQPTGGCAMRYFAISPATVPDAQTRKDLVATILAAKATGATLEVA